MKKYLALVLAALMALTCLALVACGECNHVYYNGTCLNCGAPDPNAGNNGGNTGNNTNLPLDETISDVALKCKNTGTIYVTDIGRGGYDTLTDLLSETSVQVVANSDLKASDLTANDIVVLVLGSSGKGLGGTTGHSVETELARFNAIAAVTGVELIAVVPAGTLRGAESDPIHRAVCPLVGLTLVLKGANTDGLFTGICAANTLYTYTRSSGMLSSLEFVLGR